MRRLAILIVIVVTLILIGLWSPWRGINIDFSGLFGIAKQESQSGLQVYSLSGTLQIYVDNELKGEVTPEESPFFVAQIVPGEHLVKLSRKSDTPNAYWDFNKLLQFEKNTNVIISYNLGPEEPFSEGHVIYASEKEDLTKQTRLSVNANTEGFNIQFDTLPIEKVSFNEYQTDLDLTRQHTIKLIKNGYETLEFVILPSTQEERDKLSIYDLIIDSQLMVQPVTVEDVQPTQ